MKSEGPLHGWVATCQHFLILQDAPIHVDGYLVIVIVIIIIIVILTTHVLSPIPCLLLQSFRLLHLLLCFLVPLGRESIRCRHSPVLRQWSRTILED